MASSLNIKAASDTPYVEFEPASGQLLIKGRSMPEDAMRFYQPLQEWLLAYIAEQSSKSKLTIELDYISSSSTKQLLRLLMIMERAHFAQTPVKAVWRFGKDDEVMEMKGLELQSLVQFPFELEEIAHSEG